MSNVFPDIWIVKSIKYDLIFGRNIFSAFVETYVFVNKLSVWRMEQIRNQGSNDGRTLEGRLVYCNIDICIHYWEACQQLNLTPLLSLMSD
jgi:hypothetical protein